MFVSASHRQQPQEGGFVSNGCFEIHHEDYWLPGQGRFQMLPWHQLVVFGVRYIVAAKAIDEGIIGDVRRRHRVHEELRCHDARAYVDRGAMVG